MRTRDTQQIIVLKKYAREGMTVKVANMRLELDKVDQQLTNLKLRGSNLRRKITLIEQKLS